MSAEVARVPQEPNGAPLTEEQRATVMRHCVLRWGSISAFRLGMSYPETAQAT